MNNFFKMVFVEQALVYCCLIKKKRERIRKWRACLLDTASR